MTRAVIERVKTCAIILLAVSAVLLAAASGTFDGFYNAIFGAASPSSAEPTAAIVAAARPAAIVVTNAYGLRAAAMYDDAELDSLYERTEGLLGASLGAAGEPVIVGSDAFKRALSSGGIMYEYHEPMRLDVISGWLGAQPAEWTPGFHARRVCLSFHDDTLYFQGDGIYFASASEPFGERPGIAETYAEGLRYVFEIDGDSVAPYTLMLQEHKFPVFAAANPLENEAIYNAVLLAFGVPQGVRPIYTDTVGTRAYVTNTFTLSMFVSGEVVYRLVDDHSASASYVPLGEAVETARRAVQPAAEYAGDARLYCTGAVQTDDAAIVTFNYFVNGARVFIGDRDAIRVELRGGRVTQMTLNFRIFTYYGLETTLLPVRQTLAAADGEFRLGYSAGGGIMAPFWANA